MRSAWAAEPRRGRRPRASNRAGLLRSDRGTVTAEFAVVLPAILAVLGLAVGAILLSAHRVVLTAAAAEVSRLEARGDTSAAGARLAGLDGVAVSRVRDGPLQCITLTSNPSGGVLAFVEVSARGCAATSEGLE